MKKLTTILSAMALVASVAASGCKKEDKSADKGKSTSGTKTDVKKPEPKKPEPKKLSSDAALKTAQVCQEALNSKAMDKLLACYTADAKMKNLDYLGHNMADTGHDAIKANMGMMWAGFPDAKGSAQVVIADGNKVAMISHETSTNTGEMMGMKPSGKKLDYFMASIATLDADGKIEKHIYLGDQGTFMHQLGQLKSESAPSSETPFETAVMAAAKEDDPAVMSNVSIIKSFLEAQDSKNFDAVKAHTAENISFRYVPEAKPLAGAAEYLKGLEMWASMYASRGRTINEIFGAGDWVVVHSNYTGLIGIDIPGVKQKTKGKSVKMNTIEFFEVADTMVKSHWVFENQFAWAVQAGLAPAPPVMDAAMKAGDAAMKAGDAAMKAADEATAAADKGVKGANNALKAADRALKATDKATIQAERAIRKAEKAMPKMNK